MKEFFLLVPIFFVACTLVSTQQTVAPVDSTTPATVDPPSIPPDVEITLKDPGEAHAELCQPDDSSPELPRRRGHGHEDVLPGPQAGRRDAHAARLVRLDGPARASTSKTRTARTALERQPGVRDPRALVRAHGAQDLDDHADRVRLHTPPTRTGAPSAGSTFSSGSTRASSSWRSPSHDLSVDTVNFYVIFFDQACTERPAGCSYTDLLTPQLVTGWSNDRVFEMTTTLGNTILDCHVCHEPEQRANPFLRMQEIEPPFTHWFSRQTDGRTRPPRRLPRGARHDRGLWAHPGRAHRPVGPEHARGVHPAGGLR